MRLAFLTSGRWVPSSRFRVLQYLPGLRQLGHDCLVMPSRPDKYDSWPLLGFRLSGWVKHWHRWGDLVRLKDWRPDVVVLERELFSDASFDVEQALRQVSRRLVLDLDDGLFVLHREKFDMLCGLCDHIIAGSHLLAERVRPINPRVTVIPTCVDLTRFGNNSAAGVTRNRPLVLGWTGTAANIDYLKSLREPLAQLAREFPIELCVIAESDRPLRRLGLEQAGIVTRFVRWSESNEVAELKQFDIGLMPMPDTEWTRYKCGLKILQYMAAGVPAVASPVGVNRDIIRNGQNGWLATSPDEWLSILRDLLRDPNQRVSTVAAARQTVAVGYSVESQLPRLVACLEEVVCPANPKR